MISEALKSWLEADAFRREMESSNQQERARQLEPRTPDQYTDNLLAHGIIDWRNVNDPE